VEFKTKQKKTCQKCMFSGLEKTDWVEDEGVCGSAASKARRKTKSPLSHQKRYKFLKWNLKLNRRKHAKSACFRDLKRRTESKTRESAALQRAKRDERPSPLSRTRKDTNF